MSEVGDQRHLVSTRAPKRDECYHGQDQTRQYGETAMATDALNVGGFTGSHPSVTEF